jgi:hypothetical protein
MDEQYSQETTNDPPLWPILFLSTLAIRCLDSMGAHKVRAADKPECIASIKGTRTHARAYYSSGESHGSRYNSSQPQRPGPAGTRIILIENDSQ